MRRLVALAVLSLTLAACGGGTSDLPAGATDAPLGSACDEATFRHTIEHILTESGMAIATFGAFTCSGDWAFVTADLSDSASSAPPAADQFIFRRDGDDWILKAPETVCGTFQPGDARPSDAEVPEDLWPQACTTG